MNKSNEKLIGPDDTKGEETKVVETKVADKKVTDKKVSDNKVADKEVADKKSVKEKEESSFVIFRNIKGKELGSFITKDTFSDFDALVEAGYIKKVSELSPIDKIDLETRKSK